MIRKILLFTVLVFAALPAHAQEITYCISSDKLVNMHNQMSLLKPEMQRAYNELFDLLISQTLSTNTDNAGCVTKEELAQICKNVWGNDLSLRHSSEPTRLS